MRIYSAKVEYSNGDVRPFIMFADDFSGAADAAKRKMNDEKELGIKRLQFWNDDTNGSFFDFWWGGRNSDYLYSAIRDNPVYFQEG